MGEGCAGDSSGGGEKVSDEKKSWVVKMRVTNLCTVICEGCTEQEARENPYRYSIDEHHEDISDWEVLNVTENE